MEVVNVLQKDVHKALRIQVKVKILDKLCICSYLFLLSIDISPFFPTTHKTVVRKDTVHYSLATVE